MQPLASRDIAAETPKRARRPKPRRRFPAEVLTDPEVRALLDACGAYHPVGLRNRALIALMYRAGLRVSEVVSLTGLAATSTTHAVKTSASGRLIRGHSPVRLTPEKVKEGSKPG
jgi:site-specific recombinase XerD